MRFNEIEHNKDGNIRNLMKEYFSYAGFKIVDDKVFVVGPTRMKKMPMGDDFDYALPVKFIRAVHDFSCSGMDLKSLEGCPKVVEGGEFSCNYNQLTSLIGGPIAVGGDYMCQGNPLISLDGLPKQITGRIVMSYTPTLPLLRLLFVSELKKIELLNSGGLASKFDAMLSRITNLLNKHIGTGQRGALQCAAELTKAGFKNNARM